MFLLCLMQDLEQMQAALDAEFGKDSDDNDGDSDSTNGGDASSCVEDLFCPACSKQFKSSKA